MYFSYLYDEVGKVALHVRLFAWAIDVLRELDIQTLPSPITQIY